MILLKAKDECTGCTACMNICYKDAIIMLSDDEGFIYPEINNTKCVNCGICKLVCPMQNSSEFTNLSTEIYAVMHKSPEVVSMSTSGGVFTALSDWVLENNGVIYGVIFDENFVVRYARAHEISTRNRFRGSKYVQSDIQSIFKMIEDDLNNKILVMFTGTPCQNAGLKSYFKKKKVDMKTLFTCDNVCHGVSSPIIWEKYIEFLENKFQDKLIVYHMRSKKFGWDKKKAQVQFEHGDRSEECNKKYSFNRLYSSLLQVRPSCYNCKYTSYIREADITLADFWNVDEKDIDFANSTGVSTVLINTLKGNEWFNNVKLNLIYKLSDKSKCWQPHLEYPCAKPKKRDLFWKEYREKGPDFVLKKYAKGTSLSNLIRLATPVLKRFGLYALAGKLYPIIVGRKKA